MENKVETIEQLREAYELLEELDELAQKTLTFSMVMNHADKTWDDILDGLDCKIMIREQASLYLHSNLRVKWKKQLIIDRKQWESILSKRNIDVNDKISDYKCVKCIDYFTDWNVSSFIAGVALFILIISYYSVFPLTYYVRAVTGSIMCAYFCICLWKYFSVRYRAKDERADT